MRTLLRCFNDYRGLWRIWMPLLGLAAAVPPITLAMPLVEKRFIDDVITPKQLELLPEVVALYAALWLLSTAGGIVSGLLITYLGQRVAVQLHQRLFAQCGELSLAFSHRAHTGRTVSLFANDAPLVIGLFTSSFIGGFSTCVTLVMAAAAMLTLNWQLAVVAGIVPPAVAALATLLTRPLRPATRKAQEKAAELLERIQENLVGIREVVAFGRERSQGVQFAVALRDLMRLRMRVAYMETALSTGQSMFSLAVTLVIFGYGGYLAIQGQATVGTVVAMNSLFAYVFMPASRLLGLVSGAQKGLAGADRIYAFLDETPRVIERPAARAPRDAGGRVTFEHVSFAYQPERVVLRDISLTASPGELVALVGPSGAGKSTLASLIARFYDPIEGRVLLDGVDIRDLTLEGLRAQIGIVFQDTFLFATSIRDNIAFGRESADEAAIIAAARAANAWEFVERLPQGLATSVGERGARLSEGQRQRLALARAFLRDPRILILDEPTSALDARSEHLLQQALDGLVRGRTTFVIAHRLATILRADRILVLDGGRVIEQGTHAELLAQRGLYRDLYELQFGGVGPARNTPELIPAVALLGLGSSS